MIKTFLRFCVLIIRKSCKIHIFLANSVRCIVNDKLADISKQLTHGHVISNKYHILSYIIDSQCNDDNYNTIIYNLLSWVSEILE